LKDRVGHQETLEERIGDQLLWGKDTALGIGVWGRESDIIESSRE